MTDDLPLLLTRCVACGRQTAAFPAVRLRKLAGHGKYASSVVWTCHHCGEVAHRGAVLVGHQTRILGIPLAAFPLYAGEPPAYGILTRRQVRTRRARPYRKKKSPGLTETSPPHPVTLSPAHTPTSTPPTAMRIT